MSSDSADSGRHQFDFDDANLVLGVIRCILCKQEVPISLCLLEWCQRQEAIPHAET